MVANAMQALKSIKHVR
jgi:hypothetical protein